MHRYIPKTFLCNAFLSDYIHILPNFGFSGLGETVFYNSYSRSGECGRESWSQTLERVVNGTFNMQRNWALSNNIEWNEDLAMEQAETMFDKMFNLKFLPSGRGLFAMGTDITEEKQLYTALNSCAFTNSYNPADLPLPFCFLFDLLLLGVGVGFDLTAADKIFIHGYDCLKKPLIWVVEDSREGWVDSVRALLEVYFDPSQDQPIEFDYSEIRKKGDPIKTFGGVSPGSDPIEELHCNINQCLDEYIGRYIDLVGIADLMNYFGLVPRIRRTSGILFGPQEDEFLDLKNYEVNPERANYGWTSNNSVFCDLGMDYSDICSRIITNGEPGLAWLDNMRNYSRMGDPLDEKDILVGGGNPCLEQSLESYEMCCLVEVFPYLHVTKAEFLETVKYAHLYAKTVSLGESHWEETNEVLIKNRRMGISMGGVTQFLEENGIGELKEWCNDGYAHIKKCDKHMSEWLGVNESIKLTSCKPSGTLSLLAGSTAGVHFPESQYFIRRMRLDENSDLIQPLIDAGFNVEPDVVRQELVVVEFPICFHDSMRTNGDVSIWEKAKLAAFMQREWADNQVSCTVSFKPEEADHIEIILNYLQYELKGISFFPLIEDKDQLPYPQIPFEKISKDEYDIQNSKLNPIDFSELGNKQDAEGEKFCTTDSCQI